jgi:hypothetical protein
MLLLVGVGATGAPILIRRSRACDLIRWKLSLCPQHSASPTTDTMSDAGQTPNSDCNSYSNSPATSPPAVQDQPAATAETDRRRSRSQCPPVPPCRHGFLGNLTDSLYSARAKPREACRPYHHSSRYFTSHDVPPTERNWPLPMWRRPRKQAAHHSPTPKARTQARAG